MAIRVFIAGANRSGDVLLDSCAITQREGQRHTAEFVVHISAASQIPVPGQSVRIEEDPDSLVVYAGIIQTVDRQAIRNQRSLAWEYRARVFCSDFKLLTDRRLAGSREWVNEFASNIARDLLTLEPGDGVVIDDIAPNQGPEIKSFSVDYPSKSRALDQLLTLCPSNWRWDIPYDRRAKFGPVDTASVQWTIGSDNYDVAINSLLVTSDNTNRANKVVAVFERYETDEQVETFGPGSAQPPDGSRREWTVAKRLARTPAVYLNGTQESVGIREVDTAAKWWWSQDSQIIALNPAILVIPPTGATVEFRYIGFDRVEEFVQDNADIAAVGALEGTSGIYEELVTISGTVPRGDAAQIAAAALDAKKVPGSTLRARASGQVNNWRPKPGDTIRVQDRAGYVAQTFIVRTATLTVQPLAAPADRRFIRTIEAVSGNTALDGYQFFSAASGSASGAGSVIGGGVVTTGGGSGAADVWQVFSSATGTVTPNHAAANLFLVEAVGDVTIAEPTGLRDGVFVLLKVRQDATGGHAVTLNPWWAQIDAITAPEAELCIWGYVRGSTFELEGFRQE